jgi:hypothetical protein
MGGQAQERLRIVVCDTGPVLSEAHALGLIEKTGKSRYRRGWTMRSLDICRIEPPDARPGFVSNVFFAAGPGEAASQSPVDFLLVASRLAPDAVLGYHTALEAHGYAQSFYERLSFLTQLKVKATNFRGRLFVPVAPPQVLQRTCLSHTSVVEVERRGLPCRVTSLERTAVDVLDRPDLTGGFEEVWRSLSAIPLLDLRAVLEYVRLRNLATLAAKVASSSSNTRTISLCRRRSWKSSGRFARGHRTISIGPRAASSWARGI